MGDPTIHVVTTDVEGLEAASQSSERSGRSRNVTTRDTEVIRRDIEQTRAEMGETIDAIQRKLDPGVLKEHVREELREHIADAKHSVHDATVGRVEHMVHRAGHDVREARTTVMDTIRENPIPAAIVAGGIAWLIMGGRKQVQTRHAHARGHTPRYIEDDYDAYGVYESGAVSSGYTTPREGPLERVSHRVQDAATQARHAVSETAHDVTRRTRDEALRAELGFERTYRENPIGIGLAALAIGSLVGAALPRTRREDELLGKTRDRVMERARHLAEDAVEKAKETADEKLGALQRHERT
jgi:ElaB/YqjD/DUF883 family membrane-anchored ribosome-binding protein